MSAETTPEHADTGTGTGGVSPPAEDRPVVDGTAKTAAEIRAEMLELLEEDRLRAEHESAAPVIPAPRPAPEGPPSSRDRTDEAVARIRDDSRGTVSRQVDRARAAVPERAVTVAQDVVRRPDLLAGVAGLLVVGLVALRWYRSR